MVGRTISHYQIIQKLGAGGMGEIYKAQDTKLNRAVAVKVLSPIHAGTDERRLRFLQEAQAASALNHPNIITMHDILSTDEGELMVMEYVSGKTLADLIPAGGLSMTLVLGYGVQIASALEAAHAAGIVHRDLKPNNVMVTDSGLVKVLDFGLAKLVATTGNAVSLGDETQTFTGAPLTVEGSILGTVSYMSPEQAEGKPVDARSDIFAFGAMLHEMVTGERAFAGDSTISTLSSILRDPVRPLTHIEGVPPSLQNIVERCLQKKREDRWQSMREVRDAMMLLKRDSDSGTLFLKAPVLPPPAKKSRTPLIAAAAGVLVLLVGGGAWMALRPKPASPTVPAAPIAQAPQNIPPVVQTAPPVAAPPSITDTTNPAATPSAPPRKPDAVQRSTQPATQAAVPVAPAAPVASTPAPAPTPALQTVVVADAMPISIKLAEDVPADAPAEKPIHFTVAREFRIGNNVVLPEGAAVSGAIVDAARKKLIGGTRVTYRLKEGEIPGGVKLAVRATPSKQGEDNRRPLELPGVKHPKDLAASAGSSYVAYVDGDQTVTVKK